MLRLILFLLLIAAFVVGPQTPSFAQKPPRSTLCDELEKIDPDTDPQNHVDRSYYGCETWDFYFPDEAFWAQYRKKLIRKYHSENCDRNCTIRCKTIASNVNSYAEQGYTKRVTCVHR